MSGGKITRNTANQGNGGGVGVYQTATFTMSGGTIGGTDPSDGNTAKNGGGVYVKVTDGSGNSGKFEMNDSASVTGNTAKNGGGVYVSVSGQDSKFEKNGGGVYVESGKFEMNGDASVSSNTASGNTADQGNGGGVYVSKSGIFNMNDGTITGNTATNTKKEDTTYGGGVYVSGGTFTMNGEATSVTGNTATNGGGVSVSSGKFNMNDGTISGNTGNGVFVNGGTFTVSNTPTVTRNTITENGAASNVYLAGGAYITIAGALNDGANIGVTKTVDNGVFATGVSTDCSGKFFSDDTDYEVKYDETDKANHKLVLKRKSGGTTTHEHKWTYTADKATITATCTGGGVCDVNNSSVIITVPTEDLTYNGT